jgi:hypothetical protein
LPGKDHDAERRCPREREVPGSMIGPLPMGADRFATVSSGRSFAQVAGAILRNRPGGRTLIRMRSKPRLASALP